MTLLTTEGAANGTGGNGDAGGGASGGNAGAGASGGSAGGGSSNSGGAASWRDTLPEDIRGNATLTKFTDVNALAKSYIDIQGLVGKKGVFPPGEKATPEQWKDFFKQAGQPEFDKFGIKTPEGKQLNSEFLDGYKKIAHESGLLPHQAQGLLDYYIGIEEKAVAANKTAQKTQTDTQLADLKKEWGDAYEREVSRAQMTAKEIGGEDFMKYLAKGAGNDVNLIKFLSKAASLLGEDKLRGDGGGKFGSTPAEIQSEIDKYRGDLKGPYYDKSHPGHAAAVRSVEALYQKLHK